MTGEKLKNTVAGIKLKQPGPEMTCLPLEDLVRALAAMYGTGGAEGENDVSREAASGSAGYGTRLPDIDTVQSKSDREAAVAAIRRKGGNVEVI
jgi:hypothetical protein